MTIYSCWYCNFIWMSAHEKVPNTWSTLAFSCECEVRYMGLCITILSFFSGSLQHIRFNRESSSHEEPYFIILNYIVDVTLVTQSLTMSKWVLCGPFSNGTLPVHLQSCDLNMATHTSVKSTRPQGVPFVTLAFRRVFASAPFLATMRPYCCSRLLPDI